MKQPLVLLHGWGVNSLIWNQILPLLESEFDIYVIDLPGYGEDIDYAGDYSLDAIANEVLSRAPEKAIWIGWSLGGTIAMAAAIAQPERFFKLQLVSATPRFLNGPDWDFGVDQEPFATLADDFENDYTKAVQKFLLLQVVTDDRARLKKSRTMVRDLGLALNQFKPPNRRTLRAGLEILSDTDLRAQLGNLTVETQVVAGRHDHVVPVAASEFLFNQLANGHSIHPFDAGHLPFIESSSQYIEALTTFANPTQ